MKPLGYTIIRTPTGSTPVIDTPFHFLLRHYAIDTVIDVGANEGQFGLELRRHGFKGLIISLEPLSDAFRKLQCIANENGPWQVHQCAAGDGEAEAELNVAGNSVSSSILPMERKHEDMLPISKYVSTERIKVHTLDSMFGQHLTEMGKMFLKIDVQGFEKQVLAGSSLILSSAVGVLLETSIVSLYRGSMCLPEALEMMGANGFLLYDVERIFLDAKTQQTLQFDCTFFRRENGAN